MINQNWYDWRWQLQNALRSISDIQSTDFLSSEQKVFIKEQFSNVALPFFITPHFLSLMGQDASCPIMNQVIPTKKELLNEEFLLKDPLGEEDKQKVPHLVHRYPDRVLFLLTDRCFSYCRFCTRKRLVGQGPTPSQEDHDAAFNYVKNNKKIREIVFSGGDPLLCSDDKIKNTLQKAFSIDHIEIVRFHSRVMSFLPMRVTDKLCNILAQYSPIYLVTHFNHPSELSEDAINALQKLSKAGVVLLNQSVLLRDINDSTEILSSLFLKLLKHKVKPYYLHQCDLVEGASHFRVPIKKAIEIVGKLRGHISGLAQPTFVIDIPQGLGKVPLTANPIVKEDEDFIYLQGFNGGVHSYPKN